MSISLTVVILTYNEEENIGSCLKSISKIADQIFVVDSFSTDKTVEIARSFGCCIHQRKFIEHSEQLNWALINLPIKTKWVMRLDADEYISAELADELEESLNKVNPDISGIYVKRKVVFMGKWMKYGGYYPVILLRIWKNGSAFLENIISADQHMILKSGKKLLLKNDIIDENRKTLSWWIDKHNAYARKEAIYSLCAKYRLSGFNELNSSFFGAQDEKKRFLKSKIYMNLPMLLRAAMYFIYRYILKLGFLDGAEGLCWHFLQGFWYRLLVDVKIYEMTGKISSGELNLDEEVKRFKYNPSQK